MAKLSTSIACYNLCLEFLSSKKLLRSATTLRSELGTSLSSNMSRQQLVTFLHLDTSKATDCSVLERLVESSSGAPVARPSSARRGSAELLIEEDLESESVLGRGMDGLMDRKRSSKAARPVGMLASGGLMDDKFSRRQQRPSSGRRPPDVTSTSLPDFLKPSTPPSKPPQPAAKPSVPVTPPQPATKQSVPVTPPQPEDPASSFNRLLLERKQRMADKLSRAKQNWSEVSELRADHHSLRQRPPATTPPVPEQRSPDPPPPAPFPRPVKTRQSRGVDIQSAIALKTLIFGACNRCFEDEWRLQSFVFLDSPALLRFGLVQRKGGPCGVLAAVQAEVLRELLFGAEASGDGNAALRVSASRRTAALGKAIARILWRCGDEQRAVVIVPSMRNQYQPTPRCRSDGITESLERFDFDDLADLQDFMRECTSQFERSDSPGVVLLVYSALLSRGVQKIRSDMDNANSPLMAAYGYCSQELVNLLLFGRAVSNVFNDILEVDGLELRGVPGRSDIGLLSLHEHYKSCEVGSFLKTPRFPVWLVCSESHFTVLFALKADLVSDWKAERRFDLFFYDGLARQDEEIRLSIDTTRPDALPDENDDLQPPLELCIRTKWADAIIDWNGTDPLL